MHQTGPRKLGPKKFIVYCRPLPHTRGLPSLT